MRSKLLVSSVGLLCLMATWLFAHIHRELLTAFEQSDTLTVMEYSWIFRLVLNVAGYSTVLLPGFIIYKYLERSRYFDKINNTNYISRILYTCFGEPLEKIPDTVKPVKVEEKKSEGLELAFCFLGLMGAYLIWGLLQEKIMTQNYVMSDGSIVRFTDSQFLVFVNRLSGLVVATACLVYQRQPLAPAPLYKFSFCALTNIISAWCQYEALKYVSFPTQVLSKSCKVIPVMLMGKLISNNKYEFYEYVTAVLISVGMVLFMFGSQGDYSAAGVSLWSGAGLLCVYMASDSFTASWQSALFTRYRLRALHALAAVNMFSCLLTAAALAHHSATRFNITLFFQHAGFASDCLLLSCSSAVGQLLIYRTIARFGAIVFTIIMTLRQAVSILLSCIVYGHHISAGGVVGVLLVLAAVLLRLYCRSRRRKPVVV